MKQKNILKIFRIPPKTQQRIYCVELDETYENIHELASAMYVSWQSVYQCLIKFGKYNGRTFKFLETK